MSKIIFYKIWVLKISTNLRNKYGIGTLNIPLLCAVGWFSWLLLFSDRMLGILLVTLSYQIFLFCLCLSRISPNRALIRINLPYPFWETAQPLKVLRSLSILSNHLFHNHKTIQRVILYLFLFRCRFILFTTKSTIKI